MLELGTIPKHIRRRKETLLTYGSDPSEYNAVNRKHGRKKMHSAVSAPLCPQRSSYFWKDCENSQTVKTVIAPGFGGGNVIILYSQINDKSNE